MKRNWFLLQTRDFQVFVIAVDFLCFYQSLFFSGEKEEKVDLMNVKIEVIFRCSESLMKICYRRNGNCSRFNGFSCGFYARATRLLS